MQLLLKTPEIDSCAQSPLGSWRDISRSIPALIGA